MGTKVLITGGTGFVGSWMQRTCPPGVDLACQNRQHYANDWHLSKWDYIVHLAPVSPERVLCHAKGAKVLYASSGAVYGGRPSYEAYAANKMHGERLCCESGANVVIARLFTFVGAHLQNLYAITNFIEQAKRGQPLTVTNAEAVRTYLYGEDLGRWMWRILFDGSGVYDVGGCVEYTLLEVARVVADVCPARIEVTPGGDGFRYVPDITRALELGCAVTHTLRRAIERTMNESR